MDKLDEILKKQMISSYENNVTFRNELIRTFNNHLKNIKYHVMWLFFHSFSFAYPENPNDEYKIETVNFISTIIPKNLGGCGGCQNDYKKYIDKLNIFRIVSSKKEISTFFVDLHNYINKTNFEKQTLNINNFTITINENEKGSPIYCNYVDVENMYTQNDFISLLESNFNINMFKLIENKSLSSFYDSFNKINFETSGQYNVTLELF